MAGNQVTLTFAGDSAAVEKAIARVGQATAGMATSVGSASSRMSNQMGSTEQSFDSLGRASGRLGQQLDETSGAFSQLSGGVGDIGGAMTAFTDMQDAAASASDRQAAADLEVVKAKVAYNDALARFGEGSIEARDAQLDLNQAQRDAEPPSKIQQWGEKLELIAPIIMGVVGATDLLMIANTKLNFSTIASTASLVASKIALGASAIATGAMTAAQWLLNVAMTANPIGLIVLGITALIAVVVLIATKTTWFQDGWRAAWSGIKSAAAAVGDWFAGTLWPGIRKVFDGIIGLPGKVANAFGGIASAVSRPFRDAFNAISRAWNATVGQLSWTVPGWVLGIGGNTIRAPRLPTFHTGGVVPGLAGSEVPIMALAGETVIPPGQSPASTIILRSDGSRIGELLIAVMRDAMDIRGGNIQVVTGSPV